MRLCVSIPCFFPEMDLCEAIKTVANLGYNAAETYGWESLNLENVRRTCEEMGVELMSVCTTEFRMTDPAYRNLWLEGLKNSAEAAVKLGASRLITQVGPDTGAQRTLQHESIVETLKLAGPILEKTGTTIMIEPLNTLVNHKGYYLSSSSEAFDIIREVNHPLVKVVFDIYHQQVTEGNIISNITQNLDCIAHLHAAGNPGRHELQSGENDYRFIFSTLENAGYQGACALEYDPLMEPKESLQKTLELYK